MLSVSVSSVTSVVIRIRAFLRFGVGKDGFEAFITLLECFSGMAHSVIFNVGEPLVILGQAIFDYRDVINIAKTRKVTTQIIFSGSLGTNNEKSHQSLFLVHVATTALLARMGN